MSGVPEDVKVLVAEDVPELRRALISWLSRVEGITVIGEAGDGEQAVTAVGELAPDVVLMDLRMPKLDGIEATRRIVAAHPETAVLMLSAYGDESLVLEGLLAGARGYLLKETRPRDVEQAILTVAAGGHVRPDAEPGPATPASALD